MAGAVHRLGTRCPYGIIVALCLLPRGLSTAAQATAQPSFQQMEQQRRAQAEVREALEQSERRIAAAQAEQIRNAQERSEEQRRAQSEADRRREAERLKEEILAQARAQAQQSNPPQPQDAVDAPQMRLQETAGVPPPTSTLEPLPRRYLLTRQIGLVLMIGSSIAALFVLGRIVQEYLAR
jgi:vacuolar-type H+-ATPase subunit H